MEDSCGNSGNLKVLELNIWINTEKLKEYKKWRVFDIFLSGISRE